MGAVNAGTRGSTIGRPILKEFFFFTFLQTIGKWVCICYNQMLKVGCITVFLIYH